MNRTGGLIAAWTLIGSVTGCGSMRFSAPEGVSVQDAYGDSGKDLDRLRIADAPSPTAREKIIPLMVPPQAFAVYVPQHADPDQRVWIGDHWIYIELTAGGFFAEEVREATPDSQHSVSDRELEELKSVTQGIKRIAIPYKKRGAP